MRAADDPARRSVVTPASIRTDASQAGFDHHTSTSFKISGRSKPQAVMRSPAYSPLSIGSKRHKMGFSDCDDIEPDVDTIRKEF
ncbi:hypothetical protein LTR78_001747 [Recurvomyces mirabilis]|uniref:Uncharacterized protein n=1 Tax=Recurvomyces mirabilis TaxID=574656 RepID=A0AAE0WUK2_9PEZI|nr:hypothetical protein LTR78_001747 [Recurvomyces mirabilis]KAK5150178.1 hypothetical protein LTS14_010307 [Recurvomyces mirabilis]